MITLDYYGMEGTGRTLTEAKKEAGAKIKAALTGRYSPEVLTLNGQAYLIWREPNGWHSRSLTDSQGIRAGEVYGSSGESDYAECVKGAWLQLGMNAWHGPEDNAIVLDAMPDKRIRGELQSWIGFQLAYRHKRAMGDTPDNELHRWACDHASEFRPAA